ncbi:MAG: hypothetical protein WAQ31_04490, partial [Arcanobacterium sp.]
SHQPRQPRATLAGPASSDSHQPRQPRATLAGPASSNSDSQPHASLTERVLAELARGGTVPAIAARVGTSEVFVKAMVDHFARLGMGGSAQSLCSLGQGACGDLARDELSEAARVACAGCAFSR